MDRGPEKDPAKALADVDIPKNRSWYAFQLAFILINLPGLTSLDHPDRSIGPYAGADLLWFPTGGGRRKLTWGSRPTPWRCGGCRRTRAGATAKTA